MEDTYLALITAAGASTRMGRPKALVHWHGTPLLLHQAWVLEAFLDISEVVAVVGKDATAIGAARSEWRTGLRLVDNERWEDGRSTSIEAGVAAFIERHPRGVLIVAVDQPLEREVVERLLMARPEPGEVVVPTYARRRGHPVLLAGSFLPALGRATHHPEGLRDIVRAAATRFVEVESNAIHLDINAPEDLDAAESSP